MSNLKTEMDDYLKEAVINLMINGAQGIFGVQEYLLQLANRYNVQIAIRKETRFLDVKYYLRVEGEYDNIIEFRNQITKAIKNHRFTDIFIG